MDHEDLDRLSSLPDSLICEILVYLPTKDVVKTSVLSNRWKNLWKYVLSLDLDYMDFPGVDAFAAFVDMFLGFNTESPLKNFKIRYDWDEGKKNDVALMTRWINTVVERKVQHLHIIDRIWFADKEVELPSVLYTCESLVSLKLSGFALASPKFVWLPSLEDLELNLIDFGGGLGVEKLVSGSPVLKSCYMERSLNDTTQVLRVCSQSLLSFTYAADGSEEFVEELVVVIHAPRIKYLRLCDARTSIFILHDPCSLVKADIDTEFNFAFARKFDPSDLPKRYMLRKFFAGISCVKELIISTDTLEVMYAYSTCEPLPLFRNLHVLHVEFNDYLWEMLPFFLEKCPNLKSLVVFDESPTRYQERERINIMWRPRSFLASLEYVEIERPLKGDLMELKLVNYFLASSRNLKKLTVCLDVNMKKHESAILRKLLTIPRRSTVCQVVVN